MSYPDLYREACSKLVAVAKERDQLHTDLAGVKGVAVRNWALYEKARTELAAAQRTIETLGARIRDAERLLAVPQPTWETDVYRAAWFKDRDAFLASGSSTWEACPDCGSTRGTCSVPVEPFTEPAAPSPAPVSMAQSHHPICSVPACVHYGERHPAPASAQGTTEPPKCCDPACVWFGLSHAGMHGPAPETTTPLTRAEFEALDKRVAALEDARSHVNCSHTPLGNSACERSRSIVEPPQPALVKRHAFVAFVGDSSYGRINWNVCAHPGCGGQPRSAAVHGTESLDGSTHHDFADDGRGDCVHCGEGPGAAVHDGEDAEPAAPPHERKVTT